MLIQLLKIKINIPNTISLPLFLYSRDTEVSNSTLKSSCPPSIAMVKSTDLGEGDHFPHLRWLHSSLYWAIL